MMIRSRPWLAIAACLSLAIAPGVARAAAVPATQEIVTLRGTHKVRSEPRPDGRVLGLVDAHRPITGARTALPVLVESQDASGATWLRVRLPGRTLGAPSIGRVGWILATHADRTTSGWRIAVDRASRRVTVYRFGRVARRWRAVVGKASTPTPRGNFFVEEKVKMPTAEPGGPYALATSARSSVLQEFDGGPGQIALHGRRGVGGTLGTAASHGCVRLDDAAITWLAAQVDPGTPVDIT